MVDKLTQTLMSSVWEIDATWGLRTWLQHRANLEAAQAGGLTIRELVEERDEVNAVRLYDARTGSPVGNGEQSGTQLAHLLLSGPMMLENGACSRGVRSLTQQMRRLASRDEIGGLLLEINSGGGESYAGTELQNAVNDVQERFGKPVQVYTQFLASAAVRGSAPAVSIMASNASTSVGSVGTYLTVDMEMVEEMKGKFKEVYATQSTLKNADYRDVLEGDFDRIQKFVDVKAQGFIDEMQEYRPTSGSKEQSDRLYAGDLFTAAEAVEIGLIDGVGTLTQAFANLSELVERNSARQSGQTSNSNPMGLKNFLTGGSAKDNAKPTEAENTGTDAGATEAATETSDEDARMEAMETRINELTDTVTELRASVQEQAATITTLTAANTALEQEIVQVKGTRTPGHKPGTKEDAVNASAPNTAQFKTVETFEKTTGVKSKY